MSEIFLKEIEHDLIHYREQVMTREWKAFVPYNFTYLTPMKDYDAPLAIFEENRRGQGKINTIEERKTIFTR